MVGDDAIDPAVLASLSLSFSPEESTFRPGSPGFDCWAADDTASCGLFHMLATVFDGFVEDDLSHLPEVATRGRHSPTRLTMFHGLCAPPISVEKYMERLAKYTKCSPSCFILAYVYMTRLAKCEMALQPGRLNVHRLVLTTVLLATKYTDDHYFNNAFFAKVGGVSVVELNRLELEGLRLLDYRLDVTPELFQEVVAELQSGNHLFGSSSCQARCMYGRKRRSCGIEALDSDERRFHRRSTEGAPVVDWGICVTE